jgi:hypothetical protein
MKKVFLTLVAALTISVGAWAQAKKPTIMVVPSDAWCNANGFTQTFDNQGKTVVVSDYKRAVQENTDLLAVIAKLNEMMTERGFPLKNLESALKTLESNAAEDAMTTSKSGSDQSQSPVDKLKQVAKADIIMQITWTKVSKGPMQAVEFTLQGLDSYTDKQVAGASGKGPDALGATIPELLREAVLAHIDGFNLQLQGHFEDMFANGREVIIRITKFDSFDGDLESEYGGEELGSVIENWINENTVNHRFNTTDATENMMLFEQVRIPLYDANNKPIDTRGWAKGLQKFLKETHQIEAKLKMKGLGQAQLVIGEK